MYSKTTWKDRVVDPDTGAVVQEGTFMSAEHFNNMENGIAANDSAISTINGDIDDIEETLDTGVGTTISLTINQSTFVMKLALKNSEGTTLSEQSIDLPIESMVVNAEYVEATKSLVLTLQSGSTVTVPLSALINGLVNDTRKVAGIDLKDDITVSEMKTALGVDVLEQNKVDKTTVSAEGIAETTATITVPEKAKAVSVCTMKGKTLKGYTSISNSNSFVNTITDGLNYFKIIIGSTSGSGDEATFIERFINNETVAVGTHTYTFTPTQNASWLFIKHNGSTKDIFIDKINYSFIAGVTYEVNLNVLSSRPNVGGGLLLTYSVYDKSEGVLYNAANEFILSQGKIFTNTNKINNMRYTDGKMVYESGSYAWKKREVIPGMTYSITGINGTVRITEWKNNNFLKSYVIDNTLVKQIVTEGNYLGLNTGGGIDAEFYMYGGIAHAEIPISLTSLADYGCSCPKSDGSGILYNYIDFENGLYYHNVGSVDLGSLTWNKADNTGTYNMFHTNANVIYAKSAAMTEISNGVCALFSMNKQSLVNTGNTEGISIGPDSSRIRICDSRYKDKGGEGFKIDMSGVYLNYELADDKKEVIDISDIIRPLKVESGGTVTFVNPHNIDCDTVVKYKKEV